MENDLDVIAIMCRTIQDQLGMMTMKVAVVMVDFLSLSSNPFNW